MIRVYLDWNVISNLRAPKQEKFIHLEKILLENRNALLTPFSNYHVEDILHNNKTEEKIEQFVRKDLEFLQEISQEQYLGVHDGEIYVKVGSPLKFLDNIDFTTIKELLNFAGGLKHLNVDYGGSNKYNAGDVLSNLFKTQPVPESMNVIKTNANKLTGMMYPNLHSYGSFSDMMADFGNFMSRFMTERDFYKEFRNALKELGLKLDVNQGNWNADEVIPNMNTMLAGLHKSLSFERLMETSMQNKQVKSRADLQFVSAYLLLDMFGYQSDGLPKKNNDFLNIQHDGMHAFLGAYCDIVVSEDEKFVKKCRALYSYFNISTQVYSTEEFIEVIEKLIFKESESVELFVAQVLQCLTPENLVRDEPIKETEKGYAVYKLPYYLFNYFNYAIVNTIEDKQMVQIRFRRVFKHKSRFIYYLETKNLLPQVFKLLGVSFEGKNLSDVEQQFVFCEDKEASVSWLYPGVGFALEKDLENRREDFILFIPLP